MRTFALAVGCLLLGAATLVAEDDAKKDLEGLSGTWKFESLSMGGQKLPADAIKKAGFVIKDGKYTSIDPSGKEDETGTLKLDPDKKPKTIDFEIASGKDKGKKQLGIYKLEDDTCTLCMGFPGGTERPAKFESEKGSKAVLAVLKREKK
jgi:uncharacterized protein (TIGR03067 family)